MVQNPTNEQSSRLGQILNFEFRITNLHPLFIIRYSSFALTVAWAAPDLHRTSVASIANMFRVQALACSYDSLRRQAKACTLNLKHVRNPNVTASRTSVQQNFYAKNMVDILSNQNLGRNTFRSDPAILKQQYLIGELSREI